MFQVVEWPWEHNLPSRLLKKRLWWSRWSLVSWCREANRPHLLHSEVSIKRFVWRSLSDVLSSGMAQRTQCLPSECLKMQLWWWGWSDVSWFREAIWTHFLQSWLTKKNLKEEAQVMFEVGVWPWEHNLHPECLKMRLWWCRWSDV
jgi:hypothetical protein